MEDQLDQFDNLKEKMEEFSKQIHVLMNNKMNSVFRTVQTFKDEMKELNLEHQILIGRLDKLQKEQEGLEIEIQTFKNDTDEARTKFESYQIRKRQLEMQHTALLTESSELDGMLQEKEKKISQYKEKLQSQRQRDQPEVKLYEKLLGMQIDASQVGTLFFKFEHFDDKDMARSCNFTLDVSGERFQVLDSSPVLDKSSETTPLEDILNQGGNLPLFLVSMRDKLISRAR
ncbi:hypothetical protein NCAS_0B08730 [Naumovozyma castellii]|uniref:Kinetochore protein SPC25 n=1 Tax=Naumovozyma castellii TaxID=27288 RepID=G0VAT0_NAUCA|nr:hypothetical protein NCAS_0B08730 [Naumovozyma castellii CBS 4309]CCC68957.1 hypothetical protein NCAS_0B08730 [Naumovozyma castellii CBS 4309]